ncbi:MAG: hypothetical protein ACJ8AT_17730 [Hyalangium sp.]|uniref:hypothetical protein n=1 Tax=Hyalangium sp. TaxID=2028555 RepID=UPI00389A9B7E
MSEQFQVLPMDGASSLAPPSPLPEPEAPPDEPPLPPGDSDLNARLRQRLAEPLDSRIQEELALLLYLREQAASTLGPAAVDCLELGIIALLGEKPNLRFARDMRKRLASQLADALHPLRLAAVLKTDSPSVQVMLGLGGSLTVVLVLAVLGQQWIMASGETFFGIPLHLLLLAVVGGAVGSVTSILVRIQDFKELQGTTPASMVMAGFSKPVVGACFAIFSIALLNSGLIPLERPAPGPKESFFFLALCFVSGFSERLAQDLVARMEAGLESRPGPSEVKPEPRPEDPAGDPRP